MWKQSFQLQMMNQKHHWVRQLNAGGRKSFYLMTNVQTKRTNVPTKKTLFRLKQANIAAVDISKKRKAVGRPLPTMESRLSKPADDNLVVESSEHGDGEQSSQAETLITVPVEIPVRTTISTKQQNDDSREDGSEGLNQLDESSEDSDGEQSSQAEMPSESII